MTGPSPAPELVERFRDDCEALTFGPPGRVAIAVSGGADSLALLLLAHAAYPGEVTAATVDHRLRPEASAEAAFVGQLCASLGIPHATLTAGEGAIAGSSPQAKARELRYALLGDWLQSQGINWLATAHHADDQAETLLMRLNRGAGVGGLAGVRAVRKVAMDAWAIRPLLGWRKAELVDIVRGAGLDPVDDPSNRSPDYDRTAIRALLARSPELDPPRLAASASHLAEVEEALAWIEAEQWDARARRDGQALELRTDGLPRELLRRLAARAVDEVGGCAGWRRDKLVPLLDRLGKRGRATLAGVQITAAFPLLRFEAAPPRRR